jgi:hypothetical protein
VRHAAATAEGEPSSNSGGNGPPALIPKDALTTDPAGQPVLPPH